MGITRDSRHKRRETGGKRHPHQKKRKFETGRPAANTKLGPKRIHIVRARGGNLKYRALRLETGNFSWGSEGEMGLWKSSLCETRHSSVVVDSHCKEEPCA